MLNSSVNKKNYNIKNKEDEVKVNPFSSDQPIVPADGSGRTYNSDSSGRPKIGSTGDNIKDMAIASNQLRLQNRNRVDNNKVLASTGGYSANGSYQSPYASQIQNILSSITNNKPFSYSMNTDPLYQQYSQQYSKQADLGMRDTMGNAAALTGGYGNTYAQSVGQQTYDNTMSQLNDKALQLEQIAYEKYMNEQQNKYSQLSALQGADDSNYSRYADNRNYNYQLGRDTVSDQQYQQQFDYNKGLDDRNYNYQVGRDKVADNQWGKNYDRGVLESDRNYNYQTSRDKVADGQWNQQYNYNKSVDNRNYNYQVGRDKTSDNHWNQQFTYNQNQDALNRQAAIDAQTAKTATQQLEDSAVASEKKVNKYSNVVDTMLNATVDDGFGGKSSKYTPVQVWDYLNQSDLTEDEIATIVNGNYDLEQYVTGLLNNTANKKTHSSSGSKF